MGADKDDWYVFRNAKRLDDIAAGKGTKPSKRVLLAVCVVLGFGLSTMLMLPQLAPCDNLYFDINNGKTKHEWNVFGWFRYCVSMIRNTPSCSKRLVWLRPRQIGNWGSPPIWQQLRAHGHTPVNGQRFQFCGQGIHARRMSEPPPQRWFRALPALPTRAASASVRSCRLNTGSLPPAAWRSPSFPISTRDATAESHTYLRSPAFAATRLRKPALRATLPGRIPMYSTAHPGATVSARSKSRMLGILGTKISPPCICSRQRMTNFTPSSSVSQNRVMRGSVIVIFPRRFCSRNTPESRPCGCPQRCHSARN